MDWERRFLEVLKASRPAWDEKPDWRVALELYKGLSPAEAADLDRTVLKMIDQDYQNPHSNRFDLPFDDMMVNLPAGMVPDDLLCIEAAVMVAAERGLGAAYFAFNRLLRAPRWHALYPRLEWLSVAGFETQRRLAATRAGKYFGGVLGVAVGDALGATVEFMTREQIKAAYPEGHRKMIGGGAFRVKPGEWTDDTAMTLAVARGIAESPADPVEAVGRHFINWFDGNPPDVGNACRLALGAFKQSNSWEAASQAVHERLGDRAGGNGALMRTLPTALAYGPETAQAVRIGRMTHPHPESDAAVTVYHRMVDALVREGKSKTEAFAAGLAVAGPLVERLERVPELREKEVRSSGYVVETLEAAIWSFLTTESLEACILRAVNLGDDADTVGCVAGGLAGVYYGPGAVPRDWSMTLQGRMQLEEAAEQLYRIAERQAFWQS